VMKGLIKKKGTESKMHVKVNLGLRVCTPELA
jgi:hypothetical protein